MKKQTTPRIPAAATGHGPDRRTGHPYPAAAHDGPVLAKERAEEAAVAGRHGNTGQKDHKGAR